MVNANKIDTTFSTKKLLKNNRFCEIRRELALDVTCATKRIRVNSREWIEGDGIDGEIAAPSGGLDSHIGVSEDHDVFVSFAALAVVSRNGDVALDTVPRELEDPKAATHLVDGAYLAEQRVELVGLDAMDFDVEVFRDDSHQVVAHHTTDKPSLSVGASDGGADLLDDGRDVHHSLLAGFNGRRV